jgi:hypothetical protein
MSGGDTGGTGAVQWPGRTGGSTSGEAVSWTSVRYKRRWWMRDVNQKILIAILIGIVSVIGAFLTWRSAILDEHALDNDRQAVAETVLQQQNQVNVETQLGSEQEAFADYQQGLANADELETEAEQLAASDPVTAASLRDEASSQRAAADRLASFTFSLDYVSEDDNGTLTFDLERRRTDLERQNEAAVRVNPDQAEDRAIELRSRSQRLAGWIVLLAVSIVLLTVAQIAFPPRTRPLLMGFAVLLVLVTVVASAVRF